jgi:AcrR family transcriptional regulator
MGTTGLSRDTGPSHGTGLSRGTGSGRVAVPDAPGQTGQSAAGAGVAAAPATSSGAGDGAQRSGPGRPSRLGGERERAILRATYDLLAEVGYECVRMDEVAARARASKATLYRHWPGKAQLVVDAIRMCKGGSAAAPDTGSLRGDLVAWFSVLADAVTGEEGPLLAGLVMAMRNDPELAAEMRALRSSKSPIAQGICDRAEARGELTPGYNVDLIDEIVPGQLFMHNVVLGEPVDARFIAHLVDDIILPLLTR